MKTDFLLIEVFSKHFNPQNYGHQGSSLGGLFYWNAGRVRQRLGSTDLSPANLLTQNIRKPELDLAQ